MTGRKFISLFTGTVLAVLGPTALLAAELPEHTVISKDNFDQVKDMTFEGHRVGDMIPERFEWAIREKGLTIKVRHSEKIEMDPKYVKATQEGKASVKFDPATRQVSGWKAGMLFDPHDIDLKDPYAGDKVIWNLRADTYGATMDLRDICWVFMNGESGVERVQRWFSQRYYMEGRLDGGPVTVGDGTVMHKTVLVAYSPQDIKGVGIFNVRYNEASGQTPDDTWAYMRSVRRERRLTGGAWMDPIGGTDQLYDDWDIWDAVPTKYKQNKLTGKRWVFAVAHSPELSVDKSKIGTPDEFPTQGLKKAPYYFPAENIEWEPREVFVVEGTPPEGHPYSKKVVYMEVDFPRPYLGEAYDQQGKFWKLFIFQNRPDIGDDGYKAVMPVVGHIIDFKKNHATNWSSNMKSNPKAVTENDVSMKKLIEIAQ